VIRSVVASADPSLAERLERAEPPVATRFWSGTPGFLRPAHGPGWALVGDAGYFKDPLVAHGLTDAVRDAELLARAVIAGIDCERSLAAALADYEATRDHLSLPLFETADRIASQEWDDAELDDLLHRVSSVTAAEVDMLAGLDQVVAGASR
jgi:flavin-dependent dehydrogenase